jgi:hypothetical protein
VESEFMNEGGNSMIMTAGIFFFRSIEEKTKQ